MATAAQGSLPSPWEYKDYRMDRRPACGQSGVAFSSHDSCSNASAWALVLPPSSSTSQQWVGVWAHTPHFFCACACACCHGPWYLWLPHTRYSILAGGHLGLQQGLGIWAWLALLCGAKICIHFWFWAAACFWLRKDKLLMFWFTQNCIMNGKVLIATIIFYSLGIPSVRSHNHTLSQPWVCFLVAIVYLFLDLLGEEWVNNNQGGVWVAWVNSASHCLASLACRIFGKRYFLACLCLGALTDYFAECFHIPKPAHRAFVLFFQHVLFLLASHPPHQPAVTGPVGQCGVLMGKLKRRKPLRKVRYFRGGVTVSPALSWAKTLM